MARRVRDSARMSMQAAPTTTPMDAFVRGYLHRVVNTRDLTAVDDLVSPSYRGRGYGWPEDVDALRAFYRWQAGSRPDWTIDVQQTVEVAGCVVVRAYAGGTIADDEQGRPLAAPTQHAVEWMAMYRIENCLITEIEVLALRERPKADVQATDRSRPY